MVHLVALFQAAQNADSLFYGRRIDHDRLEAPLEGRVRLDVLAVLVQGCGANRVQFAARQERLQHVGGIQ